MQNSNFLFLYLSLKIGQEIVHRSEGLCEIN